MKAGSGDKPAVVMYEERLRRMVERVYIVYPIDDMQEPVGFVVFEPVGGGGLESKIAERVIWGRELMSEIPEGMAFDAEEDENPIYRFVFDEGCKAAANSLIRYERYLALFNDGHG